MLVSCEETVTFDRYMELKFYLEERFKCHLGLVIEIALRLELCKYAVKDLIRAASNKI